ncbi:MAG: hypothetical protein L6R42_010014, partial [Xanthoria sp. 1 TBL-2021]
DAWDSYVQNSGLDTGAQLWPAMDLSSGASVGQAMEMPDQQQQQQQQQQNNMFATGANAFTGAPGNMPL